MALTEEDKTWIAEQLEAVETRMLGAFRNFAHPVEDRIEFLESNLGTTPPDR
jgi:hypothetical protein